MSRFLGLPVQAKLILATGLVVLTFFFGFKANGYIKDAEIDALNAGHAKVVATANSARLAAEVRARETERGATLAISTAAETFEKVRQDEKTTSDRRIADLLSDNSRLYVSTRTAYRRSVPGAPATACTGDGQTEQALAPAVAGRLAGRYAAYNEIVDQLTLCQSTIQTYRMMK